MSTNWKSDRQGAETRENLVAAIDLFQATRNRAPTRADLARIMEISDTQMTKHVRKLLEAGKIVEHPDRTLTLI